MISIFAKRAFYNINPHEDYDKRTKPKAGHLLRVSSIIRADQIAEKIGARLNPTSGYENDVCIYVKPMVRKGDEFIFEGQKNYLDIIDGHNLGQVAEKHPDVGVIVCSQADYNVMSKIIPNKLTLIPQHHCNFERAERAREGIKTIGVVGERPAFDFIPKEIKDGIADRGIQLLEYSQFYSRQDIIDFYKRIDLQLVWRPYKKILSNPLKIVNAASFGIPTIALNEDTFQEVWGCYLPCATVNDFFEHLDVLLASPNDYSFYSDNCFHIAEKYHIDHIAELYKQL